MGHQNSFGKRERERVKRLKATEKRMKRQKRKESGGGAEGGQGTGAGDGRTADGDGPVEGLSVGQRKPGISDQADTAVERSPPATSRSLDRLP